MTVEEVRNILVAECEQAGSQAKWAKQHGFAAAYVSDVIRGKRDPAPKILAALGLKRVACYVRP